MAKKKAKAKGVSADGFFKGYDIRWLKGIGEEHPDFHLVEESGFFKEEEPKEEPKEEPEAEEKE